MNQTPPAIGDAPAAVTRMLLAAAMVVHGAGAASAIPPAVVDAIPKDAVAAYFVDAPAQEGVGGDVPAGSTRSAIAVASFLADCISQFGPALGGSTADPSTRLWIDLVASASDIVQHPHALVLLDIHAEPREDGGHQLVRLEAALILQIDNRQGRTESTTAAGGGTGISAGPGPAKKPVPHHRGIERRIQHFLNTYTNSKESVLSCPSSDEEAPCALTDRRLPTWATLAWGPVGDVYVLAIGQGVFGRVAEAIRNRSKGLGADPWFDKAFAALKGARASFACYGNFDRLRQEADRLFVKKIDRFLSALRLGGTDRALFSIGRRGRAIETGGYIHRNGKDVAVPITAGTARTSVRAESAGGQAPAPDMSRIARGSPTGELQATGQGRGSPEGFIPDQATRYAIVDCNLRVMTEGLCAAYLATRSPMARHRSQAFWHDLQVRAGVSIGDDVLAHVGNREGITRVVLHDYPPDAFGLPFAWTMLVRIDGDAGALRERIDRLLRFARRELARAGGVRLLRGDDGVWYTQFGLMGPALTVTDHWLVVSFSPVAVRRNVAFLSPPESAALRNPANQTGPAP